jgi:hypothetical protein
MRPPKSTDLPRFKDKAARRLTCSPFDRRSKQFVSIAALFVGRGSAGRPGLDFASRSLVWERCGLASDRRRRHCVLPGHRRLDRSAVRGAGQRLRLRCACGVLAAQPSAAPATGPLQNLVSPSFANPLVLLIVSMVIGALFGYASDQLAKVPPAKQPTMAAHV